LPFIFGTLSEFNINSTENQKLSQEVQSRWINFIKTGDPNSKGVSEEAFWPKYNNNHPKALIISDTIKSDILPETDELDFFANEIYGSIQ
jgi:para-nitrobenzyl esterase